MIETSEAQRRVPSVHPNPWQRFADDWPELTVQYADIGHRHGITRWADGHPITVVLHERLTQRQRRVTITHECEHLDRGAPCESLRASIEQRVVSATARWLMPDVEMLADTLAVYDLWQAAERLWVTYPCLVDRLRTLTIAELDYIGERRGRRDCTA